MALTLIHTALTHTHTNRVEWRIEGSEGEGERKNNKNPGKTIKKNKFDEKKQNFVLCIYTYIYNLYLYFFIVFVSASLNKFV